MANGAVQLRNGPTGMVPFLQHRNPFGLRPNFFPSQPVFQQNVVNNYTYHTPEEPKPSSSQNDTSNLPEDEYSGTKMSERSLKTLMSKAIFSHDDVTNLGLELEFTSAMVQNYINQNPINPQTAAFKLVIEWRNSRSTGNMEEKSTILHDALIELGKIAQAADVCPRPESCEYHRAAFLHMSKGVRVEM